jgi:hypothetical protein
MMTEKCTLTLNREDVLQIRDALTERLNVWRSTARYLRGESGGSDFPVFADCDKAPEADLVIQHYADIIAKIDLQVS